MDPALAKYHRPNRSLVLSGISRSGTSLLSVLIGSLENAVCLNEILPPEPNLLPDAFARTRRSLLKGKPVANKFDATGQPTTDTLACMVREKRVVDKPLTKRALVGSKRNIPYLNNAVSLLEHGFLMVLMIRDPVYTIGSWGSEKAARGNIPAVRMSPGADLHPHWHPVQFTREDPIERRAEAWEHYARIIWSLRGRATILRYEQLCSNPELVMANLCLVLGLAPPNALPDIVNPSKNDDARYPDLPAIREAVHALCPTRRSFGYA